MPNRWFRPRPEEPEPSPDSGPAEALAARGDPPPGALPSPLEEQSNALAALVISSLLPGAPLIGLLAELHKAGHATLDDSAGREIYYALHVVNGAVAAAALGGAGPAAPLLSRCAHLSAVTIGKLGWWPAGREFEGRRQEYAAWMAAAEPAVAVARTLLTRLRVPPESTFDLLPGWTAALDDYRRRSEELLAGPRG